MRSFTLAAALIAGISHADAPAKPNGIKIGDGRLHPYLNVSMGYDSALMYVGTVPQLGGDLFIKPSIGFTFGLDLPATVVNVNGGVEYAAYLGVITSSSRDLSTPERAIRGTFGLDTAFNKTGPVEFQIGDQFARSDHTTNVAAGVGLLSIYNSLSLGVPIHPGGGALEVTPRVRWDVEAFSALFDAPPPNCPANDILCNPNLASSMNYMNLNYGLGGRWKFLPKTAVLLDATFDHRFYLVAPNGTGTANHNSNLPALVLKVQGGLSGLITSRISTLLLVGGGGDFGGSGARTFIAQAEVAYLGTDLTLKGGYVRGIQPVPVFGTYIQDRGYAEVKSTIASRLMLRGAASFDYLTYMSSESRHDIVFSGEASVGYQFVSFFSATLNYRISLRSSDQALPSLNYPRHEPSLLLSLSY